MIFRTAGRLCWFGWEVVVIIINYFLTAARAPRDKQRLERAAWLSRSSRRHLKIFGYTAAISGEIPRRGPHGCAFGTKVMLSSRTTPAPFTPVPAIVVNIAVAASSRRIR